MQTEDGRACLKLWAAEIKLERVSELLLVVLYQVSYLCDLLLTEREGLGFARKPCPARRFIDLPAPRRQIAAHRQRGYMGRARTLGMSSREVYLSDMVTVTLKGEESTPLEERARRPS